MMLMSRPGRFPASAAFRRCLPLLPCLLLLIALLATGACDDSPTSPTDGVIVTFRVVNETFRVRLETPAQVRAAEAALAGGAAKIPNGRIVTGSDVNEGWNWHLEDVTFAEATIEVCDGLPSHVQREGVSFGGGRYCPWSAQITAINYE